MQQAAVLLTPSQLATHMKHMALNIYNNSASPLQRLTSLCSPLSPFDLYACESLHICSRVSSLLYIPVGEGLQAKTCHCFLQTALLNKEKSYFKTELKEIKSIRFWLTVQLDILVWEVYVSTSCTNIIEFQLHALF